MISELCDTNSVYTPVRLLCSVRYGTVQYVRTVGSPNRHPWVMSNDVEVRADFDFCRSCALDVTLDHATPSTRSKSQKSKDTQRQEAREPPFHAPLLNASFGLVFLFSATNETLEENKYIPFEQ